MPLRSLKNDGSRLHPAVILEAIFQCTRLLVIHINAVPLIIPSDNAGIIHVGNALLKFLILTVSVKFTEK